MTATIASTVVVDSAEFAWNEFGVLGLDTFGAEHRAALDEVGPVLMQRALIEAWARRGRLVRLVDNATFVAMPTSAGAPADEVYHEVWQEAADAIDPEALLDAADLHDEYRAHQDAES